MIKTSSSILFIILCLLIISCRAPVMSSSSDTAMITIAIPSSSILASKTTNSEKAIIETTTGEITLEITADNMTTVNTTFSLSDEKYTAITSVEKGYDRKFTVEAIDSKGIVYARKETTIDITDDTASLDLTLKPVLPEDEYDFSITSSTNSSFTFTATSEDENTTVETNKVYVFPFSITIVTEISDEEELTFKVKDNSTVETTLEDYSASWIYSSDTTYYLLFLYDSDKILHYVITQENGTTLVSWNIVITDADSYYSLEIIDSNSDVVSFSIKVTTEDTQS